MSAPEFGVKQKSAGLAVVETVPDDLAGVVHAARLGEHPAGIHGDEFTQVARRATVRPEDRAQIAIHNLCRANRIAGIVERERRGGIAAERAEIGHARTVSEHKRV